MRHFSYALPGMMLACFAWRRYRGHASISFPAIVVLGLLTVMWGIWHEPAVEPWLMAAVLIIALLDSASCPSWVKPQAGRTLGSLGHLAMGLFGRDRGSRGFLYMAVGGKALLVLSALLYAKVRSPFYVYLLTVPGIVVGMAGSLGIGRSYARLFIPLITGRLKRKGP